MMSTVKPALLFCLVAAALLVLGGCGDTSVNSPDETVGDTSGTGGDTTSGGDSTGGGDTGDDEDSTQTDDTSDPDATGQDTSGQDTSTTTDTGGGDTTQQAMVTGLHIEPTSVSLPTTLGQPVTAQLTAWRDYDDGTKQEVATAVWSSSDALVADVDSAGLVTASGDLPGRITIEAFASNMTATREVYVSVTQTSTGGTFDPANQPALNSGSFGPATSGPIWEYPEHETLFPAGLQAPVIQWNANGNTHFVLTMSRGTDVSFTVYTDTNTYQPTPEQWRALGVGYEQPIQLSLYGKAGLDPNATRNPADRELTVFTADATLDGSVYYWEINSGSIMRIDDGATAPVDVFGGDGQCRGCHTLSRDGSKLAFMYNGGGDPYAGLATTSPVTTLVPNFSSPQGSFGGKRWDFMAFNPTGDRVLGVCGNNESDCVDANNPSGFTALWDTSAGVVDGMSHIKNVATPYAQGGAPTQPTWSPDGSTLAFIKRDDGVDWSYSSSDLMFMDWNPTTEEFMNLREVLAGNTPGTLDDTLSYPTWSPDSKWLGVGIGPSNRDATNMGIHLVNPVTGATTHMARGGNSGDDVFPSFSPFIEGGYYWLLFYSGRRYGHLSPNQVCVNAGRSCKQLWVMAIDANVADGVDGSHPAFWLPGQDFNNTNITGYWAPSPCGGEAQGCSTTSDCCDGLTCLPDENGVPACQADACALPGEACTTDADCCVGQTVYNCLPNLNGDKVCQIQPN